MVRFQKNALQWNTTFNDSIRTEYHEKKMETKNLRPEKQMKLLNIPIGDVDGETGVL